MIFNIKGTLMTILYFIFDTKKSNNKSAIVKMYIYITKLIRNSHTINILLSNIFYKESFKMPIFFTGELNSSLLVGVFAIAAKVRPLMSARFSQISA